MEEEIRFAVFQWLKDRSVWNGCVFSWTELTREFTFNGKVISLVGMTGIWSPAGFKHPISIRTGAFNTYPDKIPDDGFLNYSYRGTDPHHPDNRKLRDAGIARTPLIYFSAIKPGRYRAVWPVIVLQDYTTDLFFRVSMEPALLALGVDLPLDVGPDADSIIGVRRYVNALVKQRLHQAAFRDTVLAAYSDQCSMCRLQHPELLDAAHIIPDNQPGGDPVVQNGLSLCKIHHAAYDRQIVGVTPDYKLRVRRDVLEEVDGPMLKYGLQSLEGMPLTLPHRKANYPDRERLERRFAEFAS